MKVLAPLQFSIINKSTKKFHVDFDKYNPKEQRNKEQEKSFCTVDDFLDVKSLLT